MLFAFFLIGILAAFAFGMTAASLASKKDMSQKSAFWFGFLLGPIGLIIVQLEQPLLKKDPLFDEEQDRDPDSKHLRPTFYTSFEIMLITSQIIRITTILLHLKVMSKATEFPPQAILISAFTNTAILIGLGLVVSRARIGFARWFLIVLIALDVLGLAGIPTVAAVIGVPFAAFSTLAVLLVMACGVLMFLPPSNDWLKRDRPS